MNDDNICIKIKPSDFFSGNYSWNYYMFLWSTTTLLLWINKKKIVTIKFFFFFYFVQKFTSSFQYSKYKISFIYNQMVNFFSLFSYSDLFSPDTNPFFVFHEYLSRSLMRENLWWLICVHIICWILLPLQLYGTNVKKRERERFVQSILLHLCCCCWKKNSIVWWWRRCRRWWC